MNIALSEIWNFLALLDKEEKGWSYALHAGSVLVKNIGVGTMEELRSDADYDTELLPSIFTFREILWQPDVFTESSQSVPPLRVLKAFCAETVVELLDKEDKVSPIYIALIKGLGKCTGKAIKALEKEKPDVKMVLGSFRTCAFPIIKFFINHPQNRNDYKTDAIHRLNYAVKIMLTQFHGKYSDLVEPHWEVNYESGKKSMKLEKEDDEQ